MPGDRQRPGRRDVRLPDLSTRLIALALAPKPSPMNQAPRGTDPHESDPYWSHPLNELESFGLAVVSTQLVGIERWGETMMAGGRTQSARISPRSIRSARSSEAMSGVGRSASGGTISRSCWSALLGAATRTGSKSTQASSPLSSPGTRTPSTGCGNGARGRLRRR